MVRLKRADGRAGRYSLFTTLHGRVAGGLNYPYGPGIFQPFVMEKTARPASLSFNRFKHADGQARSSQTIPR